MKRLYYYGKFASFLITYMVQPIVQQGAELTRFDSIGKEKTLRCAAMRNASGVQKPSTFDVDDSSSSCVHTTKSSAGEG